MGLSIVEFKPYNEGYFVTELDIPMQMWLGLYVEPRLDDPSTWEDDHKLFSKQKEGWLELADKAKMLTREVYGQVAECLQYEAHGLTYREVALGKTGRVPSQVTDNKYDASEDLAFLHRQLTELYTF